MLHRSSICVPSGDEIQKVVTDVAHHKRDYI